MINCFKKIKKYKNIFLNYYNSLNDNKLFAGFIILMMNICTRYEALELSKSQTYYIKHIFGKPIMIFAILWIGTRDIFISLIFTIIFMVTSEYLFNDESKYCIIPENCKPNENKIITKKQINDAVHLLKEARKQKKIKDEDKTIENVLYKENFI